MNRVLEACIDCEDMENLRRSVANVRAGGAERIELCRALEVDGLTPKPEHIREAREIFGCRAGVLVMIRPRAGDFCYQRREVEQMAGQIAMAADAGAGGVVLGTLQGRQLDLAALGQLLQVARRNRLSTTFHRAFDELADKKQAIERLVDMGVDRVLTAGVPLGEPVSALDAVDSINHILCCARGRIEVVVGGGVSCVNIVSLLEKLSSGAAPLSFHSHTGLHTDGIADAERVRDMRERIRRFIGRET